MRSGNLFLFCNDIQMQRIFQCYFIFEEEDKNKIKKDAIKMQGAFPFQKKILSCKNPLCFTITLYNITLQGPVEMDQKWCVLNFIMCVKRMGCPTGHFYISGGFFVYFKKQILY